MNSRENIANNFLKKFGSVSNIVDFLPNKMRSKDGFILYEYDIDKDKSSLYINEKKVVDGSYALDVFLLYLLKCKYMHSSLPVKRLFKKIGLTEKGRKGLSLIFKKVRDINDYLLIMSEIDQEYPDLSVLSMETLNGKSYLNGDVVPADIDIKEYVNIDNDCVSWVHFECGKEHVVSTFIGIEFFGLAKLQNYLNLLDMS